MKQPSQQRPCGARSLSFLLFALSAPFALVFSFVGGAGCQGVINSPGAGHGLGGGAAGGATGTGGARESGGATGSGGTAAGSGGAASTTSGGATGGDANSGGSPTGGSPTGGSPTGGSATGGSPTGGSATGGSATGGSPGGGSPGGGSPGGRGGRGGNGAGGGPATGLGGRTGSGNMNAIVAVGYGGLRVVSRDLGQTWQNETHWAESGGDDNNLLRAIAFGNGLWVSGGWRYVTSPDGVQWTDRGMSTDVITAVPCNIIETIAFGAGRFVGACGSQLVWSTDGLTWKSLGATPDIQKHPWMVFDPGTNRFAVTGDNSKSFVSADLGVTWTELTGVSAVRLCNGGLNPTTSCPGFYTDGIFLRGAWPAQVQRSTNGTTWSKSITLPAGDSVFTDYSFAVGPVAPTP